MNKQRLNGRKCANETTVSLDGTSYTCSVDRAFSAALARLRKAQARLLRRHRVRKNIFAAKSASSCAQKIPAPRVYWFILHQCSQSSGNSASLLVVSNRLRLQNRRGVGRGRNSILFG